MTPLRRLLLALLALGFVQSAPAAPEKRASIEGATEYRFANGLRLLALPDPGIDTITVHATVLVGSRHEGYGEKGMAHLLEHLLFKGTKKIPNIKEELTRRGARYNGTTSNDRTTYFETFAASPQNLDWALGLEVERLFHSLVLKSDLDSEMTVVRNEFEMGENSAGSVLFQRMQQLAFPWHNYGNPIIGSRSDIEQVPIDRLQGFYRTWYRPDNILLILGGRFDEAEAVRLVEKHFGSVPRPSAPLPPLYTTEPTQDGERDVVLRRVGDNPMISALYRVPAARHPDYPAIDVLVNILGDTPAGRLHRALVQKGLASVAWGSERGMFDPGYMYFGATLPKDADAGAVRSTLLAVLESVAKEKIQPSEVERARTALLNDFERTQLDTAGMVRGLSEFEAVGDWRLYFLYRDRLKKVTVADVQRVAEQFLRPANRVIGMFVPTEAPARAEIPASPDLQKALEGYKGGDSVRLGEAFDPSPANIESRLVRRELKNGIRSAVLPKKTRGGRVIATLTLHWGDEQGLFNREVACSYAGGMLMRGTTKRSRAQIKEELERLNANVSVGGDGASIDVRRENFAAAMRLAAELLREPAFPADEFEEMKRASITGAQGQRTDPSSLASVRLSRSLQDYPQGHPHYTPEVEERLRWLGTTTLDDAKRCYRDFYGATGADFAAVGELEPAEVTKLVEELFGDWKTPRPFVRVPSRHFDPPASESNLLTPDKANATLRAGLNVKMRDDHRDFPAVILANYLLGGTSTARLPGRVREKEGLSYSTYSSFSASAFDEVASFRVSAIFAPENRAKVEQALREELARAVKDGFTADEVDRGKKAFLEARRLARSQDGALVNRLGSYLFAKRTFAWDIELEKNIASLTPAQVNTALRRHIDPSRLTFVAAGDFKK